MTTSRGPCLCYICGRQVQTLLKLKTQYRKLKIHITMICTWTSDIGYIGNLCLIKVILAHEI